MTSAVLDIATYEALVSAAEDAEEAETADDAETVEDDDIVDAEFEEVDGDKKA